MSKLLDGLFGFLHSPPIHLADEGQTGSSLFRSNRRNRNIRRVLGVR
jgi:hypothetical protein